MTRPDLSWLGVVTFEPSCVVPEDDSEIVRHAAPLDAAARERIREQQIARLCADASAVAQREARVSAWRAVAQAREAVR